MANLARGTVRTSAIVAALAVGLLAGCTATSPAQLTELPAGVSIDVFQGRFDYSDHKIAVSVHNNSALAFTVTSLEFSSPVYSPAATYERAPSTVEAGRTTDIRLLLPPAQCDAEPGDLRVKLTFFHGGTKGAATISPKDRMGQLPALIGDDCREDAIRRVATISVADRLAFTTIDGERTAVIRITFTPTGNPGTLIFGDVRGTVLLSLSDHNPNVVLDTLPLDLDVGVSSTPVVFDLLVVPARCDPHAVMEDKRGTFFRFHVTTNRGTGLFALGVSDAVRGELYNYVSEFCGYS